MLQAEAERSLKFAHELESCVGILDIVVGKFLAAELLCESH